MGKDQSKVIGGNARAKARWNGERVIERKILNALYEGPLPIGDVILDVAVLDDKDNTRVINMTSVFKAFGRVPRSNNRLINIPAFMDAQNLQTYIDQELMSLIKPIEYFITKCQFQTDALPKKHHINEITMMLFVEERAQVEATHPLVV